MAALARIRAVPQRLGRDDRGDHVVVDAGFHRLGQQAGLEAVAHDEVRVCGEHLGDRADRVAGEAEAQVMRGLEAIYQVTIFGRYGDAPAVGQAHRISLPSLVSAADDRRPTPGVQAIGGEFTNFLGYIACPW